MIETILDTIIHATQVYRYRTQVEVHAGRTFVTLPSYGKTKCERIELLPGQHLAVDLSRSSASTFRYSVAIETLRPAEVTSGRKPKRRGGDGGREFDKLVEKPDTSWMET